jgi:hypothetical protein
MKTHLIAISVIVLSLISCKKEEPKKEEAQETPVQTADTIAPVITLNGNKNDTTYLGIVYVDAGASVIDNKDGNISPWLVVSGVVNNTLTGTYMINYYAKDSANNQAQVTRTVSVLNTTSFLDGNYNVANSCTAQISLANPTITTSNYTATVIASNSIAASFTLSSLNIGPVSVAVPHASYSNGEFSIYYNAIGYTGSAGTGTLSVAKNSFTIETLTYDQMYPSRTYKCRNIYTKQ